MVDINIAVPGMDVLRTRRWKPIAPLRPLETQHQLGTNFPATHIVLYTLKAKGL